MSWVARIAKGGYSMRDLEHTRSLLRLAHRDLNALIGMGDSPLFADEPLERAAIIAELQDLLRHVAAIVGDPET